MNASVMLSMGSPSAPIPRASGAMPNIVFGEVLQRDSLGPLRGHLSDLVDPGLSFRVDALPVPTGDFESELFSPDFHLVFDFHRLFVFRSSSDRPDGFRSLMGFLRDSYPIKPLRRMERHVATRGFEFFYPLEVLDLLPLVWADLEPAKVAVLDLVQGEVSVAPVLVHPEAETHFGSDRLKLRNVTVDASLREGFPTGLEDFVSPASIVQKRATFRDRLSLPLAAAEICWQRGNLKEACFGKNARQDRAEAVAVCEALERYQVAVRPAGAELVFDSFRALEHRALDPRTLFFGREACGSSLDGVPFDPDARLYWTPAFPAKGGEPILVPAQDVWFHTDRLPGETKWIQATTNGCALGGSAEEAALFGLLETVERDAFLTTWYLRRRPRSIDPGSVRDVGFQQFRRRWQLAFPAYDFRLFDITSDLALPTVMAVAVRRAPESPGDDRLGPKVFFATACRPNAEDACRIALQDLAGFDPEMTAERRAELRLLLENPEKVSGPSGHFELYSLDEVYGRLGFLDLERSEVGISVSEVQAGGLLEISEAQNLRTLLGRIDEQARSLGVGIYFKDLTQTSCAERGLHCVKAITPGLFPIWFGHNSRRFYRTPRLERLARTWFEPGDAEARLDDINLEMHPFS